MVAGGASYDPELGIPTRVEVGPEQRPTAPWAPRQETRAADRHSSSDVNERAIKELAEWFQGQYDRLHAEVSAEPDEWAQELASMPTNAYIGRCSSAGQNALK